MTDRDRRALVVRGGWPGHAPEEAAELFVPFLKESGFDVTLEGSLEAYADTDFMAGLDLVVQCWTMGEILPDEIRLTLGVRDVLVLRNLDDVPQVFGPTLMMPGQGFRLPFAVASRYSFACTAHASGQMRVIVDPYPATPWARILWRIRQL